jgi:hypothetical protein
VPSSVVLPPVVVVPVVVEVPPVLVASPLPTVSPEPSSVVPLVESVALGPPSSDAGPESPQPAQATSMPAPTAELLVLRIQPTPGDHLTRQHRSPGRRSTLRTPSS